MVATIAFQLSSITPYLSTPEDIRTSFARIAEIGYRYVQLQGVPSAVSDDVIVTALQDSGLTCVATQEDFPVGFGADPERAIRRALAVGASYLTCALIPQEVDSVAALHDFAETLSAIATNARCRIDVRVPSDLARLSTDGRTDGLRSADGCPAGSRATHFLCLCGA